MKEETKKKSPKPKEKIPAKKREAPTEEKPFDFGGLPARNLKKNLGC
ncbi:MAG TPA: hypothetical protein PLX35_13460 [Cyclobacteriaceae bacterium]|nr:hypothetical protein [Cyclobacteriaceae bacterium]